MADDEKSTATTTDDDKPKGGDDPAASGNGKGSGSDAEILKDADNPDAVKRALDAERAAAKEARKRAEDAEAKVKDFEDADKSDKEKLEAKADDAESRAKTAEAKALRYEVAGAKDLPLKWADRLRGDTKEELEADADELLKEINPDASDFGGGGRGSSTKDDSSMDARIRRAAGRGST